MKLKLPCCEINKMQPEKTIECDQCQCVFAYTEQLDDHIREMHEVQFTGKRKLRCCISKSKRMKNEHRDQECHYCECLFTSQRGLSDHMAAVHQCSKCHQIMLTEEIRAQHEVKHKEEQRKQEDIFSHWRKKEKEQREKDDDLVLNYIKTNKLDEYQPDPNYKPNTFYITHHCNLKKEEVSRFVKKFQINPGRYAHFKRVSTEHVEDHLERRYYYDEEQDELSIVVGDENKPEYSLGSCKKLFEEDLQKLIQKYNEQLKHYNKYNNKVSDLFDEREQKLEDEKDKNERECIWDYYEEVLYKDALWKRNVLSNEVAKLYFVIAKK